MRRFAAILACCVALVWTGQSFGQTAPVEPAFSAKLALPFATVGSNQQPVVVGVLTAFRPAAAVTWLNKEKCIGYGASLELPFVQLTTWHVKLELGVTYTTCTIVTPGPLYGKTVQLVGVGLAVELREFVPVPFWLSNISLFVAISSEPNDPARWAASTGLRVRF